MRVTLHGVRGSYPCPSPANIRYGANTASVCVEAGDEPPILLDLGTGVHRLEADRPAWPRTATALLTHLHLDHVQGLPFFPALQYPGASLDVYAPNGGDASLAAAFARLVDVPHFPFRLGDIAGEVRFHEVGDQDLHIGGATVRARPVPHVGPTLGYRIEWDGATVAYVSDHQAPPGLDTVDETVLELCDGADLLIHEGQYTRAEYERRASWGHCTPHYAVLVARQAGVRRLCVFHHDPRRTDDELDELGRVLRREAARSGLEDVIVGAEGTTIET